MTNDRIIAGPRLRPRPTRLAAARAFVGLVLIAGCHENGVGTDASLPDAGDARIGQDVDATSDARVDAAPPDAAVPDAQVDAAPNPNVIVLPPSGQTDITAFTNGGFIATWSEQRGTVLMGQDVYYFDVIARQEVQVTNREGYQTVPSTDGSEIMYGDSSFTDELNGIYQVELFSYSIPFAQDLRLTSSVSQKRSPIFNDSYVLYKSDENCAAYDIYNLTLMDRGTGDATVISDCGQAPETHSIGDDYAAWAAIPYGWYNKDIFVRDLAAGYTFRIESTDVGNQYFPSTDSDHVVWQDDRDGRREVYMYTISTGVEECLTPDSFEQGWPFLRDGIVSWCDYSFSQQSGQNADCDIYVYEIATGVGRRVTTESKRWRPRYVDSGWILYAQRILGMKYKLYMHDLVSDGILSPDGHVIPE